MTAPHPRVGALLPDSLQNKYIIMRHGFSVPNERELIVSSLVEGVKAEYGLTEKGRQQARDSAITLLQMLQQQQQATIPIPAEGAVATSSPAAVTTVVIVSSPFSRARETAQIVADELLLHQQKQQQQEEGEKQEQQHGENPNHPKRIALWTPEQPVWVDVALRERNFGEFELQSHENYHRVWAEDAANGDEQTAFGAESCASVWSRVRDLIVRLEGSGMPPSVVVLVSHGDTLQMTQTGVNRNWALSTHRQRDHLNQAEWRLLHVV